MAKAREFSVEAFFLVAAIACLLSPAIAITALT